MQLQSRRMRKATAPFDPAVDGASDVSRQAKRPAAFSHGTVPWHRAFAVRDCVYSLLVQEIIKRACRESQ